MEKTNSAEAGVFSPENDVLIASQLCENYDRWIGEDELFKDHGLVINAFMSVGRKADSKTKTLKRISAWINALDCPIYVAQVFDEASCHDDENNGNDVIYGLVILGVRYDKLLSGPDIREKIKHAWDANGGGNAPIGQFYGAVTKGCCYADMATKETKERFGQIVEGVLNILRKRRSKDPRGQAFIEGESVDSQGSSADIQTSPSARCYGWVDLGRMEDAGFRFAVTRQYRSIQTQSGDCIVKDGRFSIDVVSSAEKAKRHAHPIGMRHIATGISVKQILGNEFTRGLLSKKEIADLTIECIKQ